MFDDNDNPYRSPTGSSKGTYNWTTAKRIFVAVSALAIVYLSMSAVGWYQLYSSSALGRDKSVVQQLRDFVQDWNPPLNPQSRSE